nr:hypothetical protein [uncultured Pseudoxanthomonas sp.]
MKSRAQLDADLARLADMLPPWLQHLRHEAQFWPQFEALAQDILRDAAHHDRDHVQQRLDAMLAAHGKAAPGRDARGTSTREGKQ